MKQITTLAAILAIAGLMAGPAAQAQQGDAPAAAEQGDAAAVGGPGTARGEDEKRKVAELQEARRLAEKKMAQERETRQKAWEARCVIKPAMSDEEIAICREVRTKPAP